MVWIRSSVQLPRMQPVTSGLTRCPRKRDALEVHAIAPIASLATEARVIGRKYADTVTLF
jgi:hypothetical protein